MKIRLEENAKDFYLNQKKQMREIQIKKKNNPKKKCSLGLE